MATFRSPANPDAEPVYRPSAANHRTDTMSEKSSDKAPKILLVEDDIGLQKQIKWSLDEYEILVAGDRESALAQLRRFEPAVVLLDLGLPPDPDGATEGLATLQQILQLCPLPRSSSSPAIRTATNAIQAISWAPSTSITSRSRNRFSSWSSSAHSASMNWNRKIASCRSAPDPNLCRA
jgi:CheY-like chemotaxis protein